MVGEVPYCPRIASCFKVSEKTLLYTYGYYTFSEGESFVAPTTTPFQQGSLKDTGDCTPPLYSSRALRVKYQEALIRRAGRNMANAERADAVITFLRWSSTTQSSPCLTMATGRRWLFSSSCVPKHACSLDEEWLLLPGRRVIPTAHEYILAIEYFQVYPTHRSSRYLFIQ